MLFQIAFRNLLVQRFKTLLIGLILIFGTFLVVSGNAIMDSLEKNSSVAIINSISGHLQIFSADAKDDFEIFRTDSSKRNVGEMDNFLAARETLEALPEVDSVVPMGLNFAVVFTGNFLDKKLGELRDALDAKDDEKTNVIYKHVKRVVDVMRDDMRNLERIADMRKIREQAGEEFAALERTKDPDFWNRFKTAPYEVLEFLENKVAKLALGEDLIWVNYIGTDTKRFGEVFDKFKLVQGETIPHGQRGLMFNKRFYDRFIKNKTARRLDLVKERLDKDGLTFDACEDCQTWIKQNVNQVADIAYQLDDEQAATISMQLRALLSSEESNFRTLLAEFMRMDAENFHKHYEFFYDNIAPHIMLYTVPVGETMVLTSFGRGGYVRKVPVKVYGTFKFEALDDNPTAGGFNLVDIMTFRELYGFVTAERLDEIKAIQDEAGIEDLESAEDAEDALFGDESELVETTESTTFDATDNLDMMAGGEKYTSELMQRVYSQQEIDGGLVVNAAIMLKDGVSIDAGKLAVQDAIKSNNLNLKVIDWKEASGLLGQFVLVVRSVLYAGVGFLFLVALVVINNSILMSTLERTVEIGTMRAMGAQRGFVLRMILFETVVLSLFFGGGGVTLGAGLMTYLNSAGIAAWNETTRFLFAGPRLYPELAMSHLVSAVTVILIVAVGSTLYPAMLATRITPREAMSGKD
jgi:ABC-type lipoprotein release transport system permease subunit